MHIDIIIVLAPGILIAATVIAVFAGIVKGTVGFALPMIMISGLGSIMPPDLALAALILSALASNVWQALRGGLAEMVQSAKAHWKFIAMLALFLLICAQFVTDLSPRAMFLFLGIPVVFFAALQLAGFRLRFSPERRLPYELGIGAFAGGFGGISGIWGPPTVLYLTALDTPKDEQMRVQGVVYGAGAVLLTVAHLKSGILNGDTVWLSAMLVVPSVIGLGIGFALQDRIDQQRFRRLTLLVLVIAGLNLVRRGIFA